jgi:hypothetical protein
MEPVFHQTKHALVAFKIRRVIRSRGEPVLEKIGWTGRQWVEVARGRREGSDLDSAIYGNSCQRNLLLDWIRRLGAVLRKTIFDIYAAMPSSWNTPRMAVRSAS